MKTHAEIVAILKKETANLRNRCGVAELTLLTRRIEFEPVSDVTFGVEFTGTACVDRLKVYLEKLLAVKVGFLPRLAGRIEYKIIARGLWPNPEQRVRDLVKENGWTDEFFAKMINIRPEGLQRIYAGKSYPDKIRQNMAAALEVPFEELFGSK